MCLREDSIGTGKKHEKWRWDTRLRMEETSPHTVFSIEYSCKALAYMIYSQLRLGSRAMAATKERKR